MPFAQWLQNKMEQHGFSNYRIAKMAGVHQSTVANWLSGAKPQAEKEKLVRKAIGDYELASSQSSKNSPAVSSEGSLDAELIKRLIQLTPEEMQKVDAFVQGLLAAR